MRTVILSFLLCCLNQFTLSPEQVSAEELTIVGASDLNFALKDLAGEFEKETGEHVKLILGSSGHFYTQITNGAPFDLYFSADITYPKKLIEGGFAVPDSLYQYATGRIVLWVPKSSPLDVTKGMSVALDPAIKKVSIANPQHAPYGRAAMSAMQHYQVYDRVKEKLVMGENISQATQFVTSGAADIGIIALSLALAPTVGQMGTYWLIPSEAHPAIEQGVVIVKRSKNYDKAKRFLEFIKTAPARAVMKRYGFVLPEESNLAQ